MTMRSADVAVVVRGRLSPAPCCCPLSGLASETRGWRAGRSRACAEGRSGSGHWTHTPTFFRTQSHGGSPWPRRPFPPAWHRTLGSCTAVPPACSRTLPVSPRRPSPRERDPEGGKMSAAATFRPRLPAGTRAWAACGGGGGTCSPGNPACAWR